MEMLHHPKRTFLTFVVALCLLSISAPMVLAEATAVPQVSYVDAVGAVQTLDTYTSVSNETTNLASGWYVADQSLELSGALSVTGDAHIVICDGCTLTVPQGVSIAEGAKLTLLPQQGASGKLVAKGSGVTAAGTGGKVGALEVPVCVELTEEDGSHLEASAHTPRVDTRVTSRAYVAIRPLTSHDLEASAAGERTYYTCKNCGDFFDDAAATTRLPEAPVVVQQSETAAAEEAQEEPAQQPAEEQNVKAASDEEETVAITFDANGGTGTMETMEVTAGVSFVLPECGFTAPEGKEFDRWNVGTPGSSVTVDSPTTVVAQWKDTNQGIPSTTDNGASTTTTNNQSSKSTSDSPATGDHTASAAILVALVLAGAAAAAFGMKLRRTE